MQVLIVSEDRSVGEEIREWVSESRPGALVDAIATTAGADEALRTSWDLVVLEVCDGIHPDLSAYMVARLKGATPPMVSFCPQTYQKAKLAAAIKIELDARAVLKTKRPPKDRS